MFIHGDILSIICHNYDAETLIINEGDDKDLMVIISQGANTIIEGNFSEHLKEVAKILKEFMEVN